MCGSADGIDGLHGVHDEHPHLTPADTWKALFKRSTGATSETAPDQDVVSPYFTASDVEAHKDILRILKENPVDTITIAVVGPMTNVALAAARTPRRLLRVKEVVVMGGAILLEGNITPVAEFNTYADPVARRARLRPHLAPAPPPRCRPSRPT